MIHSRRLPEMVLLLHCRQKQPCSGLMRDQALLHTGEFLFVFACFILLLQKGTWPCTSSRFLQMLPWKTRAKCCWLICKVSAYQICCRCCLMCSSHSRHSASQSYAWAALRLIPQPSYCCKLQEPACHDYFACKQLTSSVCRAFGSAQPCRVSFRLTA